MDTQMVFNRKRLCTAIKSRPFRHIVKSQAFKSIFIPAVPLILGGLIYILWRSPTLLMFHWFEAAGLSSYIEAARGVSKGLAAFLPVWVLYSLPDAAWTAAGVLLFAAIWSGSQHRVRHLWVFLTPTLAIAGEFAQFFHIIPGTFDFADVLACILSTCLSLYIANRLFTYAV